MQKIWIAGASGMLGSHVQRLLKKKEISFIANDYPEVDITDLDTVTSFVSSENISHIINCAAYTQVDQAEIEKEKAYKINAIGPYHLGIAAKKQGARVVHFSTDYVFDGKEHSPYTEEHYCTPLGVYGMSKLAGEIKLLEEHRQACVIRTSWLFGFPGKNFVQTMMRLMKEKEELQVVSDQVGRPTYCEDLAEAALMLLEEEGVYHFANSQETSWYTFATEIHRQMQENGFISVAKNITPILSYDYPTLAQRPMYSTLCTKKIEEHLGIIPRPWQEALKDYLTLLKQAV